jgi:hypothetical protein
LLPPVVVAAIPPAIHPTSSCSLGWGGWCVVRRVVLVLGSLVVVPIVPIRGGGVTPPIAPKPPSQQWRWVLWSSLSCPFPLSLATSLASLHCH